MGKFLWWVDDSIILISNSIVMASLPLIKSSALSVSMK
jgi:hypothetical protein